MYEERIERICALLCLTSSLERREGDPAPFTRSAVRRMLAAGMLDGLVLRKTPGIASQLFLRAQKLLGRAGAVFARIEAYFSQGYQIILEDDALWPGYLYKLGADMPLYLFAKGNAALLRGKKAAVAGSRVISEKTRRCAGTVGSILAEKGIVVVSGGARGVDSMAVWAALDAGGSAVVVPAMRADEFFRVKTHRDACEAGRLLVLCETPPDEAFSSQKALTRNHTIYALGDIAMVIASKKGIGGSWSGARACLKQAWSPLYLLDEDGKEYEGNAALIEMGAMRMRIVEENGRAELLLQGMDEEMLHKVRTHGGKEETSCQPVRLPVQIDLIPRRETLRYLGWKGQELDQQTAAQISRAEAMAFEAIEPAVVIGEFALEAGRCLSGTTFSAKGEAVSLLLDGCQGAILMAATLGAKSERLLLRTQAVDKALSTVLDAVFSAAIERVCDRACEMISLRAKQRQRETTARFSPGYGDMPMEQTREICDVLDAGRRIGLSVSENGLMIPRKSVCAIVGEGERIGRGTQSACALCAQRKACRKKGTDLCTRADVEG